MTSPTSAARPDSHDARGDESLGRAARRSLCSRGSRRARSRAFTVVELLVVIGIIVILASILIPTVMKMQKTGARTRQAMDFQTIGAALQAYHQDFGAYPTVETWSVGNANPVTGAELLVLALVAPGDAGKDGSTGPGFRIRKDAGPDGVMNTADDIGSGRTYGPYLPPDKFKIKWDVAAGATPDLTRDRPIGFIDLWGEQVILYYPASPAMLNVNIAPVGGVQPAYVGDINAPQPRPQSRFNYKDNSTVKLNSGGTVDATLTLEKFRAMLGDANNDGWINTSAGENALAGDKPFILWSAGPDRTFGPPSTKAEDVEACDDVTNLK